MSFTQLRPLGSAELTVGAVTGVDTIEDIAFQRPDLDELLDEGEVNGGGSGNVPAAALAVPSVHNTPVTPVNRGFSGFDALDHFDQRFAGTGDFTNTQFSLEPPDQGLCVGNGFVLETINTALAVYRTDGTLVAGPTALNQFFGLAPEVIRSAPPVFGDFTSDPRCYFDAQTNRFFVLLLQLDVDPATGAFTGPTHQLLAVSKSGDRPTDSTASCWTTADGPTAPAPEISPCSERMPTASHQRKRLLAGRRAPKGAQIWNSGSPPRAPRPSSSISLPLPASWRLNRSAPATHARGGFHDFGAFLSSFDQGVLRTRWCLSLTTRYFSTSRRARARHSASSDSPRARDHGIPPDALQRIGTLPLGSAVNPGVRPSWRRPEHGSLADGRLWSTVSTVLNSPGTPSRRSVWPNKAGVAWFAVRVDNKNNLKAKVDDQIRAIRTRTSCSRPSINQGPGCSPLPSPTGLLPSTG